MKKSVKIILCVLLSVIIIGGCVTAALLPHPLSYNIKSLPEIGSEIELVAEEEDGVTLKLASSRDFKVISFTDMHLNGKNKTSNVTLGNFTNAIIDKKPDLVILGGDNVTSIFNKKRTRQLAEIFEQLGVYWAPVLGNHEGDTTGSVSREEMTEIFSSYPHCLMKKGAEGVWGNGNYYVNVLNADDSLRHTFVMMDTGSDMSEELKAEYGIDPNETPYDGVKTSQVEWYRSVIDKIGGEYGKKPSTVIMHIPLPQMKTAAESEEFLYGVKLENVCASGFDSGMFDAIIEKGSTDKVFFGHDHVNDFALEYEGIYLSYLQSSGYGAYTTESKFGYPEKDWLQGYTLFEINEDGEYDPIHHRYSE